MGRKEKLVYASQRHVFVFVIVIIIVSLTIYFWDRHIESIRAGWPSAQVSLSEFRTLPVQVIASQRGSHVVYQAEAHVRYVVDRKLYTEWLPILSRSDSQQSLQFDLSGLKESFCYVHWDQAQPDHAFLTCIRENFSPPKSRN